MSRRECCLCDDLLEDGTELCVVKEKGLQSFIEASTKRKDGKVKLFKERTEIQVHVRCRKNYTTERSVAAYLKRAAQHIPKKKRSITREFSFKTHCFICGNQVATDHNQQQIKNPPNKRNMVYNVTTLSMREKVLSLVAGRQDELSQGIVTRLEPEHDLVAVDAQYHRDCMKALYRPHRQGLPTGRPVDNEMEAAIHSITTFLKNSDEECQFTFDELMEKIEGDFRPHPITLRRHLIQKFGDDIVVTTHKPYVVCFKATGHKIITENWHQEAIRLPEEEKRRHIVEAAAAIVVEDIRSQIYNLTEYPGCDKFLEGAKDLIPETTRIFVEGVVLNKKKGDLEPWKKKSVAIAHSLISAVRPRSFVSPLQVGLGAFLYKKYGSRKLIDVLSSLGFCAAYNETTRFEVSTIMRPPLAVSQQAFIQMVYDNADFNIQTLDGRNTFHSMGSIRCVTPSSSVVPDQKITRLKTIPSAADLGSLGAVPLQHFEKIDPLGLAKIKVCDLSSEFPHNEIIVPSVCTLVWFYCKSKGFPGIRGWNGFMEQVTDGIPYEKTSIDCQPFINAPPSDYDTVYTSLTTAVQRTRSCCPEQKTTFVTFDQPLYLKAKEILASREGDPELEGVVIRLGGFHLLMSFMGAVGYIMEGSGLTELFNTVYAPNSTEKIMTGHAYARAVRGHTLAATALAKVIMDSINFSSSFQFDIDQIVYAENWNALLNSHETGWWKEIEQSFKDQLLNLSNLGPTAKLWVQYFEMITLMMKFIESERMGNWKLHLEVIHDMLPYFHASGHYLYAKCAHMYIQDMINLEQWMPLQEYQAFTKQGSFTIRRSDKCWCGTWSDMCIEQQLMKNMKVEGGLTRARGFSEGILSRWTLGMTSLQHVANDIEDFCGVRFGTSDQHADSRDARVNLDITCTQKMVEWFQQHPAFQDTKEIMSISTGVVGNEKINCHLSREVGTAGIMRIVGTNFAAVTFRRKDRVLPLATVNSALFIEDRPVIVKPTTLFQRMVITKQSDEELQEFLTYELAPYPPALFDDGFLRKGTKSSLYKTFKPLQDATPLDSSAAFVIDGGLLLHRVVWSRGFTFNDICKAYINYTQKKYGPSSYIVFDGYSSEHGGTKAMERLRRSGKKISFEIQFSQAMTPTLSQENFLSNSKNKSRLITMLMAMCEEAGITCYQATEDADGLIVQTAESLAPFHKNVAVVAEDVDILVIMMGLRISDNIYLLKPGRGKDPPLLYHPKSAVNEGLYNHMMFLHAMSGCDSTSAIFNQGKTKFLKTLTKHPELEKDVERFLDPSAQPADIAATGESFLVALYGGDHKKTNLDELRYKMYVTSAFKISSNIASIPPTAAAARQHSLRVYFQVQQWLGNLLPPVLWGWKATKNGLLPLPTDKPPAPDKLMQSISCKCRTDCGGRCGCRRSGLFCSQLCVNCADLCTNVDVTSAFEEEEEDDEFGDSFVGQAIHSLQGIYH